MAEILQITSAHPDDKIAWADGDDIQAVTPTCLALVKEGSRTRVVYMEVVDGKVEVVDPEDKDFLGFYNSRHPGVLKKIQEAFESRKKK
jgi:hypothetical protein